MSGFHDDDDYVDFEIYIKNRIDSQVKSKALTRWLCSRENQDTQHGFSRPALVIPTQPRSLEDSGIKLTSSKQCEGFRSRPLEKECRTVYFILKLRQYSLAARGLFYSILCDC